jgi:predicted Fe-Mo cluster-binding NifX family protein
MPDKTYFQPRGKCHKVFQCLQGNTKQKNMSALQNEDMNSSNFIEKGKFMKIALPSYQNQVDEHFGNCQYFTVFTIDDNNRILTEETITPPAGCGCKSNIAQTLAQMGVKFMLAGNMGQGAVNVLGMSGIRVLRGCSGNVKDVAERWLAGNLNDSGVSCTQHEQGCQEH